MKDLGAAKQILGMRTVQDRKVGTLTLSQEQYIEKVLCTFNMQNAKLVKIPLAAHFKLSREHSPKIEEERKDMEGVTYEFAIGSLMYADVTNVTPRQARGTATHGECSQALTRAGEWAGGLVGGDEAS